MGTGKTGTPIAFLKGQRFGKYRIEKPLGGSGMSHVYLGYDEELEIPVAMKFLMPAFIADESAVASLKKQTRIAMGLNHPNIAATYDLKILRTKYDERIFIVMEYVDGSSLADILKEISTDIRKKLCLSEKNRIPAGQAGIPFEQVKTWAVQACEGLAYAHKKGVYHLDIKPSNLMLKPDGELKILDFGSAMSLQELRNKAADGVILTTALYMPPETLAKSPPAASMDIYSLGATLYELLTGFPPFTGDDLLRKIITEEPKHIREINPGITAQIAETVMQCLRKNPDMRFSKMEELSRELLREPEPEPSPIDDSEPEPEPEPIVTKDEDEIKDKESEIAKPPRIPVLKTGVKHTGRLKRICFRCLIIIFIFGGLFLAYNRGWFNSISRASNGVITDKSTGLEWFVGPDNNTTWHEAKDWVDKINRENFAGGNWRMPTPKELRGIYQRFMGTRNMDPVFETKGWWVWSEKEEGSSSAWGFNFNHGYVYWDDRSDSNSSRVFAVRSR
ncbi:MAG: hypothetical protein A2161_19035 [Candidatus Schekmanbacteria bacterium RBG_13_48_7]|uniref:Protein kinase domain-containing protein n=1 Tax=Candidatus Schekmanbacteria bacterium RBG_13_48_7 TaxID=1817878 RepID=A0A1F7RSH8_9BACT|nr:MAG: hypothetical protein A2161_19035 [Candidatus Schekmanbacteria bacterium RBG_13_48_7]